MMMLLYVLCFCVCIIVHAHDLDCGHASFDVSSAPEECFDEQLEARAMLPHVISRAVYPQLPRFTVAELELPQNAAYKMRTRPFILTDAMEGWPALEKWSFDPTAKEHYLTELFPQAVTDFYPHNMLKQGSHPYLFRFRSGMKEVLSPTNKFTFDPNFEGDCQEGCRYIHLQLSPEQWGLLESLEDIPRKRHNHLEGDRWWMRRCLQDADVQEEYHLKTHWKIILIGTQGAGMFNHTDSLQTGSWHGHVQGRKWWYVCGVNEGPGPNEGDTECFESVLTPGEVLYYGRNWWHHTRNLDSPTMTVTGTVVTAYNYDTVAARLHGECSRKELNFDFSAKLCDSLDVCYGLWHKKFTGKDKPENLWRPWRSVASDQIISDRDKVLPHHNNYDGRNYISD